MERETAEKLLQSDQIEDFFYLRLAEQGRISPEAGERAKERIGGLLYDEGKKNAFKTLADQIIEAM